MLLCISAEVLTLYQAGGGGGGTCYVGVPGDMPFLWVYFFPENSIENSKAGYHFLLKNSN